MNRIVLTERKNKREAGPCPNAPKRGIAVVGIITFLAVQLLGAARTAFPASPNVGAILGRVSSVYSHLQDYHIEAELKNNLMRPFNSKSLHTEVKLDAAASGRVRLALAGDGPNVLIVSDGKTTWQYATNENEYTEREAVFLSAGPSSQGKSIVQSGLLGNMQDLLVDRFEKLGGSAKAAKFEGNATVKLHGKKIPCYRISLHSTEAKDEFWIDQSNFLVLRENIVRTMGSRLRGSYATADLRVTEIRTHTSPSPGLFTFKPPAGARRVSVLDVRGLRENLVGSPAENFKLPDVLGKKVSLSDFRGKTVLLGFWATWCPPCQKELPTIQKIYEQDKDKGVIVLAVDDENEATIRKFLAENHYNFTALIDGKRELFKKFSVHLIPTVFVINHKGIIVRQIVGWEGPQDLLSAVKAVER